MRFLSKRSCFVLLATVGLVSIASPALAADTSNAELVIIREGDVFPEDLYAGAVKVVVEGTIDGDLVAFAADEVIIRGTVNGSVTALTPRLTIDGEVNDSVRMAGERLDLNGTVGGDVVAAVVNADFSPSSSVAGDVLLWAWDASALGTIDGDLTGSQRSLELAGDIGGDVDVSVSRLDVVDDLVVGGDLGYRSSRDARGLEMATVGGATVGKSPLPPNIRVRALGLLGRFLAILFLSVAALSIAYGWPGRTVVAVGEVGRKPVRRWVLGAMILFSPAIAVAVTLLILSLAPAAAAFPLLVVLIPLTLALLGVVLALSLMAGAPVAGWLGGVLFRRLDFFGAVVAGSLLVGVIWTLPLIGWLVPIVVLPLGMGAWIAAWSGQSPDQDAELPTVVTSS